MVSWLVPRRRGGNFEASLLAKHIPQDDCREYDWQHHNRCYEHDRPSAESSMLASLTSQRRD